MFLLLSCLVLISFDFRFKDKNCALQYNLLLEKADIPTRKRGEKTDSSETPAQRIVNQLAQERIAELKVILGEDAFLDILLTSGSDLQRKSGSRSSSLRNRLSC